MLLQGMVVMCRRWGAASSLMCRQRARRSTLSTEHKLVSMFFIFLVLELAVTAVSRLLVWLCATRCASHLRPVQYASRDLAATISEEEQGPSSSDEDDQNVANDADALATTDSAVSTRGDGGVKGKPRTIQCCKAVMFGDEQPSSDVEIEQLTSDEQLIAEQVTCRRGFTCCRSLCSWHGT